MTQSTPHPLKARLLAMMVLRVVLAIAFLGITTWFQIKEGSLAQPNFYLLYAIVVVISLLTIFYARAINWTRNVRLFAYLQVTADIALVTIIVYVTGGVESYLTILYLLSVMGSSILLNRVGGFYAASASSIAYGFLMYMDFYGMLPLRFKVFWIPVAMHWEDVVTTVSSNILAFFTVAYLTGYLSERTARIEKELHEKGIDLDKLERLSRHILENITSGIMTLDERLRITSFNRAAETITGYTLRDAYQKFVGDIFPGVLDDAIESGRLDLRLEKRFRKKDGTELFLGLTISRGQGEGASVIVIFQDLTRLKAMEEQLRRAEKLKALGELSVGIAHEIRNPLASISGSIQVLKNEMKLIGEDRHLMDIVLMETERLNVLITDFLLFARPAQEKRDRVNLSALVDETIRLFRHSPQAAGITIESDLSEGVYVEGDARQLGQVFWNLFLNSAQAMAGKGTLSVSSYLRSRDSAYRPPGGRGFEPIGQPVVAIRVADTGCGITAENIDRIFDPFFSTKDSGTGLGLAIAHRITESHGGSIEVKSVVGRGTVFTVILPIEESVVRALH